MCCQNDLAVRVHLHLQPQHHSAFFFQVLSFSTVICLCTSTPSASKSSLYAFWNLCDQWKNFQPSLLGPLKGLVISPQGLSMPFEFPFSSTAPLTDALRNLHLRDDALTDFTLRCSIWNKKLKKKKEKKGEVDDIYFQCISSSVPQDGLSLGFGHFWRVPRHAARQLFVCFYIHDERLLWVGNYQMLINLCKLPSFSPILHSLSLLLSFPMMLCVFSHAGIVIFSYFILGAHTISQQLAKLPVVPAVRTLTQSCSRLYFSHAFFHLLAFYC